VKPIEEELRALLTRSDSPREGYLSANPFPLSAAGYAGTRPWRWAAIPR